MNGYGLRVHLSLPYKAAMLTLCDIYGVTPQGLVRRLILASAKSVLARRVVITAEQRQALVAIAEED